VADTEDDDDPYCRPQTAVAATDDAVDDAADVCLPYHVISQWPGPLLGNLKRYPDCYAIFCYRLGGLGSNKGGEESYQR